MSPLTVGVAKVLKRSTEKNLQSSGLSRGSSRTSTTKPRAQGAKEFRNRGFTPGVYSQRGSKNTRALGGSNSANKPQTKAQISKNIIAQAKLDLLEDMVHMSLKEEEDFLQYMEENLYAIQDAHLSRGGKGNLARTALAMYRTFKAIRTSFFIFNTAVYFVVPQLTFGIFSLIGFTGEMIPFFKHVIPGQTIFVLCWVIVSFIGFVTMLYAALVYLGSIVNCFGGMKGIVFVLCICAYFIPLPLLNAFPWFILWLWAVSSNQGKKDDPE